MAGSPTDISAPAVYGAGNPPVTAPMTRIATPSRMRRWLQLAQTARCDTQRRGPLLEIHYRPLPGVAAELEALIAAESRHCPFLTWTLHHHHHDHDHDHDCAGGRLVVRIEASTQHPEDIDGIALLVTY